MKTLISMTEFVITQWSVDLNEKQRNAIKNYANFLSLTPEIWQFVPCDMEGNVLEEPKFTGRNFIEVNEYQTAKERCYFDGFELRCHNGIANGNISITFTKSGGILLDKVCDNHFENIGTITTLEQLTDYNLQLTATAKKVLDYETRIKTLSNRNNL